MEYLKGAAIAAVLVLGGCGANPTTAERILSGQGMTNIEVGGYTFFGCSEDDWFRSTFTALDANGKRVNGVICGGFFKGYTVRYN